MLRDDAVSTETSVESAARPAYASWGQRFGAWVLDWLLIIAVFTAVALALGAATGTLDEEGSEGLGLVLGLLLVPSWPLYFALFHAGARGQTPGKRLAQIAVRSQDLGRLSFGRSLGRAYLILALSAFTFYVGTILDVLWPLWDDRHQALHDKAVGSIVVRKPLDPEISA